MLTIFTTPKPFEGHIGVIQRNAIQSWVNLDPGVEVLIIGQEQGIEQAALDAGARHIHAVARNEHGTPLVSAIFSTARQEAQYDLLCYANADVIFLDDTLNAIRRVQARFERFLIVGQRYDLAIESLIEFDGDWIGYLRRRLMEQGRLHKPSGSDYFIFPRGLFSDMPPFALGRAGWDNWMLYSARRKRMPLIDATSAITVVHQDHDYAHLPDGQPHYRLPESGENVRLAGGQEAMFSLLDANWRLDAGSSMPERYRRSGVRRSIESSLVALVGPGRWARGGRMVMHPIETIRYYLRALRKRFFH